MKRLIETGFPHSKVSELARRERRSCRPYQLIHPWPGRRPGVLFRALILASLLPEGALDDFWRLLSLGRRADVGKGRILLDPFMGSGTSIVEALSLGMRAIGADINAVAWFIARETLVSVSRSRLRSAVEEVLRRIRPLAERLYSTVGGGGERTVARAFYWVKTVRCEKCGGSVELFKQYRLAQAGREVWVYCPSCSSVSLVKEGEDRCPLCGGRPKPMSWGPYYRCPHCGHVGKVVDAVRAYGRPGMRLIAAMYRVGGEIRVKVADEYDLERYREAEALAESLPPDFMDLELRPGEETSRVLRYGYRRVRELFNARQLVLLHAIYEAITPLPRDVREPLALALSKTLAFSSLLTPFSYKGGKPESMFMLHQYMHEKMYIEVNVLDKVRGSFLSNALRLLEAKGYVANLVGGARVATSFEDFKRGADVLLLRRSSLDLGLPSASVDLVVTDPPHFGNTINSGIADFHYAILKPLLRKYYCEFAGEGSCDDHEEITVDPLRHKGVEEFRSLLAQAFAEARRVLKPGGLMVVLFRHRSREAWDALYASLRGAGLEIVREWPLDAEGDIQPQARFAKAREGAVVCRQRGYDI